MSRDRRHERFTRADSAPLDAVHRLAQELAALPPDRRDVPPRALLVGGFVRDALLDRATVDADVEVYGVPAERLEPLLETLHPGRLNTVGRSFGIFKIHLGHGIDVDVSLPRSESKTGSGHRGFSVVGDPFLPFSEAARRRDFTINALAADPLTGEVLDAHGGLSDLDSRVLRAVDRDTFPEDPLRVWRAVQLSARLEAAVEPGTLALMRGMVGGGELRHLTRERVTEELRKLLEDAARPSVGVTLARQIGALADRFPEIEALAATPQDEEWHPEGDVFVHTMMVLDHAAGIVRAGRWALSPGDALHVTLGALLHDVGKPATTARALKDGRIRIVSPRHEAEGEAPARAVLDRLTFGEEAERAVLAIVRHHLSPGSLYYALERGELDPASYTNAVRKVLKRLHPVPWSVLLAACEADWRGRGIPGVADAPYAPGLRFAEAVAASRLDEAPAAPLVLGRDVLALGIPPGPEVGRLIDAVEEARDRGEIRERDEALTLLRRLAGSRPKESP